jgi:hypothetical protein
LCLCGFFFFPHKKLVRYAGQAFAREKKVKVSQSREAAKASGWQEL